jgi:hypothetical protein
MMIAITVSAFLFIANPPLAIRCYEFTGFFSVVSGTLVSEYAGTTANKGITSVVRDVELLSDLFLSCDFLL